MTTIGLVQINSSFANQSYLPYSVGILQAYAQAHLQHPEQFEFLIPVYKRQPVVDAIAQLTTADAVFFSAYVWNVNLSTAIAKEFKAQYPDRLVVFGGPQVPDQAEDFLRQHPYIDLVCHNEGEQAFVQILEHLTDRSWGEVGSVSWLEREQFHTNPWLPRLKDFQDAPSPFLSGIFDPLMQRDQDQKWIAIWESDRGCIFRCSFCDWASLVNSKVSKFDMPRIEKELEWIGKHQIGYVFCANANFGMLPRDIDIVTYLKDVKERTGYPEGFSVQNTKNATERAYQVQKVLHEAKLQRGVVLSMQSLDPTTLKAIKRDNIKLETYRELQKRFNQDGIETYSDLILALPGETYDSFVNGVCTLLDHGQHNRIQFNNLSILPNAEMGDIKYQQQYGMQTVQSKEVNIHGSINDDPDDVPETSQLVIATNSMPRADWVKTRAFCWMTALLHFDKLLQIPILLTHHLTGSSYRQILEAFMHPPASCPLLQRIKDDFLLKASILQNGGSEYVPSKQWLNIWWPADEAWFIELSTKGELEQFYQEAESLLTPWWPAGMGQTDILRETILLNHTLLKQPFQYTNLSQTFDYPIWAAYRALVKGESPDLNKAPHTLTIDRSTQSWSTWEDWCRQVVWWENKKGAYLYKGVTSS